MSKIVPPTPRYTRGTQLCGTCKLISKYLRLSQGVSEARLQVAMDPHGVPSTWSQKEWTIGHLFEGSPWGGSHCFLCTSLFRQPLEYVPYLFKVDSARSQHVKRVLLIVLLKVMADRHERIHFIAVRNAASFADSKVPNYCVKRKSKQAGCC